VIDDPPLCDARGLNCPSYEVLEVEVSGGELCDADPVVLPLVLRLLLLAGSGSLRISCSSRGIYNMLVRL
jgi:hypothetical protein